MNWFRRLALSLLLVLYTQSMYALEQANTPGSSRNLRRAGVQPNYKSSQLGQAVWGSAAVADQGVLGSQRDSADSSTSELKSSGSTAVVVNAAAGGQGGPGAQGVFLPNQQRPVDLGREAVEGVGQDSQELMRQVGWGSNQGVGGSQDGQTDSGSGGKAQSELGDEQRGWKSGQGVGVGQQVQGRSGSGGQFQGTHGDNDFPSVASSPGLYRFSPRVLSRFPRAASKSKNSAKKSTEEPTDVSKSVTDALHFTDKQDVDDILSDELRQLIADNPSPYHPYDSAYGARDPIRPTYIRPFYTG